MLVAFVAVSIVAFAGCSKDDINNNNANNGGDGGGNVPAGWVDLGLPSGLLWAECNVGATAPEEYGDYFAWAETEPKEVYNWNTYRYCTVDAGGMLSTLTKYNSFTGLGAVDNLTTLESVDDAATARMDSCARTPTKEEWEELINNTTAEWTTVNNVHGRKFTASTGNSIFLPAAGWREEATLIEAGSGGYYWSASADTGDYLVNAWGFGFRSDYQSMGPGASRNFGMSVRAVRSK